MPEWQISADEYLKRLSLDLGGFIERLQLPDVRKVATVLPLRDLRNITSVIPLSLDTLSYLLCRVQTLDGRKPFERASFRMMRVDPAGLFLGQRFVYRENYQGIMENVLDLFERFLLAPGGLGNIGAYFVFGFDECDTFALACYLPPLMEQHGSHLTIMDGIHRSFIARQTGMTLNAILIENISEPFPCALHSWADARVIPLAEKPTDIRERYFELQKELFRDLKYLGIDG